MNYLQNHHPHILFQYHIKFDLKCYLNRDDRISLQFQLSFAKLRSEVWRRTSEKFERQRLIFRCSRLTFGSTGRAFFDTKAPEKINDFHVAWVRFQNALSSSSLAMAFFTHHGLLAKNRQKTNFADFYLRKISG